ncbi:hypothetical protein LCGC14_0388520 [marine sediment metagenome]|uniref:Nucleotide-diphospho-sugar transferase domain-containing protein n=1 Tax=marine sediment metagenome TaxID=412755 RepID=A0A0F9T0B4_9ZZZZ
MTKQIKTTRGIIILALGHAYWGRWAYNLAMSIKYTSPDAKITLLYAGDGKSQITDLTLFDKVLKVNPKYYLTDGRTEYMKAKTALYSLSPYDETIYMDADVIWLNKKPVNQLFEDLKAVDFTMANRSWLSLEEEWIGNEFGVWASPKYIKDYFKFKTGKFYNLSSEMIYFKKDKKVAKLFADAFKLFDEPLELNMQFNLGMPDELPFTIAMIKNDMYPHQDNYKPFYWEAAQKPPLRLEGAQLQQFYAYSMGGHMAHPIMKKTYDNYVKFYCKKFSVMTPYLWIDKRNGWMPGRSNL